MTSSQRPEVVECKKLPTCDQNKKEREREEKTHSQNTLSRLLSVPFYSSSCKLPVREDPRNGMVGTAFVGLRILVSRAPGFRKPKREEAGAEDKSTSGSRFVPSLLPNLWIKNLGGRWRRAEMGRT